MKKRRKRSQKNIIEKELIKVNQKRKEEKMQKKISK